MKREILGLTNLRVMINLLAGIFLLTVCCSKESQSSKQEEINPIIGNWEWIKFISA
jgi:hypothetical protein